MATSLIDVDDIVPQTAGIWYHQKRNEAEKAEIRIEELIFVKKQYEEKKAANKKAKRNEIRIVHFCCVFNSWSDFSIDLCVDE